MEIESKFIAEIILEPSPGLIMRLFRMTAPPSLISKNLVVLRDAVILFLSQMFFPITAIMLSADGTECAMLRPPSIRLSETMQRLANPPVPKRILGCSAMVGFDQSVLLNRSFE